MQQQNQGTSKSLGELMKVNIDKYIEAFKTGTPKLNIKAKDAALSEHSLKKRPL